MILKQLKQFEPNLNPCSLVTQRLGVEDFREQATSLRTSSTPQALQELYPNTKQKYRTTFLGRIWMGNTEGPKNNLTSSSAPDAYNAMGKPHDTLAGSLLPGRS